MIIISGEPIKKAKDRFIETESSKVITRDDGGEGELVFIGDRFLWEDNKKFWRWMLDGIGWMVAQ